MPFSFNPGQQPATAAPGTSAGWQGAAPTAAPIVAQASSGSPIYYFQQIGKEKTVNAYIQIVLIVVSILSVIVAGVLYAVSLSLSSSIEKKKDEIAAREMAFKQYPYAEMKESFDRMMALDRLLKEYASVRSPFRFLEKVVENQIMFTKFSIVQPETGGYTMYLTAVTNDYKVLVQQLEALKLAEYIKISPSQKIEKISENKGSKLGSIVVDIVAPAAIKGMLPDDIIFDQIISSQASSTSTGTTTTQTP